MILWSCLKQSGLWNWKWVHVRMMLAKIGECSYHHQEIAKTELILQERSLSSNQELFSGEKRSQGKGWWSRAHHACILHMCKGCKQTITGRQYFVSFPKIHLLRFRKAGRFRRPDPLQLWKVRYPPYLGWSWCCRQAGGSTSCMIKYLITDVITIRETVHRWVKWKLSPFHDSIVSLARMTSIVPISCKGPRRSFPAKCCLNSLICTLSVGL